MCVCLQLKKNNQDFFPLNRALSLDAEEDSSERKLETLMSHVEYLVAKMKEEVSLYNFLKLSFWLNHKRGLEVQSLPRWACACI